MKKLLIFLPNLNSGGAERITIKIANYLSENDYEILLVTAIKGERLKSLLKKKVRYKPLNLKNQWRALIHLPFIIYKYNPDVVFSTMKEANFIAILSSMLSLKKTKIIIREANTVSEQLKSENKIHQKIKNKLISLSYKYADIIVALSNEIKVDLINTFNLPQKNKYIIIPNFVNFDKIKSISSIDDNNQLFPQNKIKLVTVARFHPQKNHSFLINALKHYKLLKNDFVLYLIGDGPLLMEIKKQVYNLELNNNIIFLGYKENPISIVDKCDVFILPSNYEGFSNALLEAMSLNKKILISNAQDTSMQLLKDFKNGRYYIHNDINNFTENLTKLLESPVCTENDRIKELYEEKNVLKKYMEIMK